MFFILSKLFGVLCSPFVWVIGLFLISFFLSFRFKRKLRWLAFILLLLLSNSALFNLVSRAWEEHPVNPKVLDGNHRIVVVLGGMASENKYNGLPRFSQSSDRLWQGLFLLKQNYADTLIISGGLGYLFDKQKSEGVLLNEYLTDIGIKNDSILIESASRNTFENARNTALLFRQNNIPQKIILVTSAFHMPRARACFEKQGFDLEVFPADPVSSTRPMNWKDYFIPSAGVIAQWEVLFREWAGMMMYKINGYI